MAIYNQSASLLTRPLLSGNSSRYYNPSAKLTFTRIGQMSALDVKGSYDSETAAAAPAAPERKVGTITVDSKVGQKFADEMTARLNAAKSQNSRFTGETDELVESLSAAADEVRQKFGQDKANEFMSRVLALTDSGVTEYNLGYSVSGFFQSLAEEFMGKAEGAENPADSKDMKKLKEMLQSLNRGLEASLDEKKLNQVLDEGQEPGLAYNLNKFFGVEANLAEDLKSVETQGFATDFQRVKMAFGGEIDEDAALTVNGPGGIFPEKVTMDQETLDGIAAYLRETAGGENAAAYFQQHGSSNFMEAVTTTVSGAGSAAWSSIMS